MGRLYDAKRAPGVMEWDRKGTCWNNMRELMVQYGVEVAGAGVEAAATSDGCQARGRSKARDGEEEGEGASRFHRSFSP